MIKHSNHQNLNFLTWHIIIMVWGFFLTLYLLVQRKLTAKAEHKTLPPFIPRILLKTERTYVYIFIHTSLFHAVSRADKYKHRKAPILIPMLSWVRKSLDLDKSWVFESLIWSLMHLVMKESLGPDKSWVGVTRILISRVSLMRKPLDPDKSCVGVSHDSNSSQCIFYST